ncbi:MAG: Gfo/Idh/MocA family oxidoreductase [Rhodospirillales bacterium]|nr:MAG: Gfo/Idh/MocA family oxidoreductase [Rhodospirillales bacterium]
MSTSVKADTATGPALLVGYGAFGAVHARAWASLGREGALVIADSDAAAREAARRAHPAARVVADWRVALADVAMVDIAAPSDAHAAIALAALDAGRDVFIEKPMAETAADAEAVARRAAASGRIVQVGYVLRVHPVAARLRDVVRRGGVGAPVWIAAEFVSLKRPRRDCGVVRNDAIHFLDLIRWLVGRPPDDVSATLVERLGRGFEDIATITMRWEGGPVARLDASCLLPGDRVDPFVAGGFSRKRIAVTGDAGEAVADFMDDTLGVRPCRMARGADGWWTPEYGTATVDPPAPLSPVGGVAGELRLFIDAVASRAAPDADAASGVDMARVIDAIFASAREGRRVPVAAAGGSWRR